MYQTDNVTGGTVLILLDMSLFLINLLSINAFNLIQSIPFISRPQITSGQSQLEARYSAVKGFELMSIGLAACKFNG